MNLLDRIRKEGQVLLMGILNVTPDSFSDGGQFYDRSRAVERALEMEEAGAHIIDIGGESTRPGADEVPLEEELSRTLPVIEGIRDHSEVPISIDTYKSGVAEKALRAGAHWINDISALRFDPQMAKVAGKLEVPVVLMHMQGSPQTMQQNPTYEDVMVDIKEFFHSRIDYALEKGLDRSQLILDPGIGFGKTVEHNFEILRRFHEFVELDCPLLLGTSRKSFLGAVLDLPAEERLEGTLASNVVGILRGADVLRVHDVREMNRARRIAVRCKNAANS